MNTLPEGEFRPFVAERHGAIRTTSLKVAEHFGKAHRSVLSRIRTLECSEEFRLHNFVQASQAVEQPNGGTTVYPIYELTKDGFLLLAMGYTGPAAMRLKEAYIAEFNRMEAAFRAPVPELSRPKKSPALPAPRSQVLLTLENGVVVESRALQPGEQVISGEAIFAVWDGLIKDQARMMNRLSGFCAEHDLRAFVQSRERAAS